MTDIHLETKNLSFTYHDGTQALKNVNIQIKKGEKIAIMGPNGAGKSTLFSHFNGLTEPTSGHVEVDGDKIIYEREELLKVRQKVGIVFQDPNDQLFAPTVKEDVAFGPMNLGLEYDEVKARITEALEMVGMTGFEDKTPHHLSGGQQKRVAIAGIIAMRPDVVVLDEPTAMLDPKGRDEVMETMMLLNKGIHMTVVLITHFMEEAIMADRVCVLSEGKLALLGSPASVFSNEDALQNLGLTLPPAAAIAQGLRKEGYPIPKDCLTMEALAQAIRPYLKEGSPCSH